MMLRRGAAAASRQVAMHWTSCRGLRVLGIETSCDDTAAAVVDSTGTVLAEMVAGQHSLHAPHGGIVPTLAARAHRTNLPSVLQGVSHALDGLDAVAVTVGPGLSPCLHAGRNAAVDAARRLGVPVMGVNHLEAHALVSRMLASPPAFPFLVLLVSGGHCTLFLARGVGDYCQLGEALDDSPGEAFDKVARTLGVAGGGPALSALAATGNAKRVALPVPMESRPDCCFSFSGLKTAAKQAAADGADPADVAAAFERSAVAHLVQRLRRALLWCGVPGAAQAYPSGYGERRLERQRALRSTAQMRPEEPPPTSIVVCGGVAANSALRAAVVDVAGRAGVHACFPPASLCTDNGVMVAWCGVERLRDFGVAAVAAPSTLEVRPRWPIRALLG